MGQQRFDKPDDWEKIRQTWLFDDFYAYLDALTWSKLATTGAGVAVTSAAHSWLVLTTGTTINSEVAVQATNKIWQWSANHPTHAVFRVNFQEANVNNLGLFLGFNSLFTSGTAAINILTNGNPNTIASNFTGCGFFLPAGSTTWNVVTSVGTTQNISTTQESAIAPTSAQDMYLLVQADVVGSIIEATFMTGVADVTGGADSVFPTGWQQVRENVSGFNKPVKHRVALAGAAQMSVGAYAQNSSTTGETLNVDLIGALSLR